MTPFAHIPTRLQQIRWSIRYRGLGMTALSCLANVLAFAHRDWYWKYREQCFDRRHRIDTQGLIPIESLNVPADKQHSGWGYMATQPEWFHTTMSQLAIDFSQYNFVDFGSGKGRALLLAAELPFRQVTGVEFCEDLQRIAEQNIRAWSGDPKKDGRIQSLLTDATSFKIPDGPGVLYFYNPFKAETLARVLHNIAQSLERSPRHLVIVYANPTCHRLFDEANFLVQTKSLAGDPAVLVYETVP